MGSPGFSRQGWTRKHHALPEPRETRPEQQIPPPEQQSAQGIAEAIKGTGSSAAYRPWLLSASVATELPPSRLPASQ
jgi:hypothetical protein